jgi:outer membrane protein assembly factor BamE (lipoprotein component of BamABCDE complex)
MRNLGEISDEPSSRRIFQFRLRTFILVIVAVSAALAAFRMAPNLVSWSEIEQVHKGMTMQEVAAILGRPSDHGRDHGERYWRYELERAPMFHGGIYVYFNAQGRVARIMQ